MASIHANLLDRKKALCIRKEFNSHRIGLGRRTVEKTTIGLNGKKSNFARAAHFFSTLFFGHFFTVQKLLRYTWSRSFLPLIFTLHWWPLAFLICHRRYKIFMLFFQQKMSSLFFFFLLLKISAALVLVKLRRPAAYFLLLYIPNLWT